MGFPFPFWGLTGGTLQYRELYQAKQKELDRYLLTSILKASQAALSHPVGKAGRMPSAAMA